MIAAKIEQPIQPSFQRMIKLLEEEFQITRKKSELIDLEEKILRTLDFNLRSEPPVAFLERFFRIFGIDYLTKDSNSSAIVKLAHMYCRFIQLDAQFLEFKPSQ